MSGRRSRTKGASFERWVAKQLQPIFPGAKRGIGQARASDEVPDVQGTPWWIECKRHKKPSIPAAWRQANEARDGRRIVVITKADYEDALFTAEPLVFSEMLFGSKTIIPCYSTRMVGDELILTVPFEEVCRILNKKTS